MSHTVRKKPPVSFQRNRQLSAVSYYVQLKRTKEIYSASPCRFDHWYNRSPAVTITFFTLTVTVTNTFTRTCYGTTHWLITPRRPDLWSTSKLSLIKFTGHAALKLNTFASPEWHLSFIFDMFDEALWAPKWQGVDQIWYVIQSTHVVINVNIHW